MKYKFEENEQRKGENENELNSSSSNNREKMSTGNVYLFKFLCCAWNKTHIHKQQKRKTLEHANTHLESCEKKNHK